MKVNKSFYTIGIILIFLAWLIIAGIINDTYIFPSMSQTFLRLQTLLKTKNTYISIFNTVGILVIILLISFVVAMILSLLSTKSNIFKQTITPLLALLKIVPLPALIILLLTHQSRAFVSITLTSFMVIPLMFDIIYGQLISINKDIIDELKLLSPFNMLILFRIYIPLIKVGITTAFLQAFGLGLKVKVMTEFVANAPNTIGYELSFAGASYAMDLVFAWTLILIVIVVITDLWVNILLKKYQSEL